MNNVVTPAIHYLQERQIPHRVFIHDRPVESLEQAAQERSQRPEQVIRSIVFRVSEGEYVMVLMPGPAQVPWKALRRYLNQSRLTMASEEELLAATGYRPGTVSPFGLPKPMRVLIHQGVMKLPEISLGSGQRGVAILLEPATLQKALDEFEIVDFR